MCTLEEKEKESKMRTQTVRYRVYEEWITHPQLGRYCCYGIVCESYLPKHGWQLQQAVSDITDDRNAAKDGNTGDSAGRAEQGKQGTPPGGGAF